MKYISLLVFAFAVVASTGFSQTQIVIANPSFEDPAVSGTDVYQMGAGTSTYVTGWTTVSAGDIYDLQNSPVLTNQDGLQHLEDFCLPSGGYQGGGMVYQVLTTSFVPGTTYTLTASAGAETNGSATPQVGDYFFIANSSGTVLASTAIAGTTNGVFTRFTTPFTSTGLEGDTGAIEIGFASPSNSSTSDMEIDDFSLTATPASGQAPAVMSDTASAQAGAAFSYQIVATNSPTSFGATNLPAGLSVNTASGLISGTPTQSGLFNVALSATNANGTGNGTLSLNVSSAPVQPPAVSSDTASAQVGSAFSYQIVATNSPTSFGASGLPAGLSVDAGAGLISGTPTQSGTFTVGLTATNSGGTGTGTLSLTVAPASLPQPAITLTSPPIDETVVTGSTLPAVATVSDPAGILSQVQFTLNGAAVAPALTAPPYIASVVAPAPGTYVLQATATDNLGRQSTSSHMLTVIAAPADPAAPSADLITDVNRRKIGAGATIILTCIASSADGSPIQMVSFYANGTLFASDDGNGNPIALPASLPGSGAFVRDAAATAASSNTIFQAAFQLPVSGSSLSSQYNLLAIAFSKLGTAQTSDTVTVTPVSQSVDQPPQIALAGLTNGQHLTTGSSYTASTVPSETAASARAVVSAPAGTLSAVAKIEYYLNKLELLNASVSGGAVPNFTFTAPAPGEYVVEAIATDTAGVASVADPINVQIDPLPVVTVSALGDGTAVVGGKKVKVLISRTGDTSSALAVSYKVSGTAVKGVDYVTAPSSRKLVIPAGSASVKIKIEPIADPAATAALSAKIKLTAPASGAYTLGSPSKAKITILQH